MDLANKVLSRISVLKSCKEVLPEEEYKLIEELILESKLKYYYLSSEFYLINDEQGFEIPPRLIDQLYLYYVVDNQIFIRLHMLSFITSHLTYKILLSRIVEREFPDIPCDTIITIYGCEYNSENNIQTIQEEQILEDQDIINKFPWNLERNKYHFYKYDYKYQKLNDTFRQIQTDNMNKFKL